MESFILINELLLLLLLLFYGISPTFLDNVGAVHRRVPAL